MATFRQILKNERQSGGGILSSIGSAAFGSAKESMDVRNRMFKSGTLLNALFPNVKGYQAINKKSILDISKTSQSLSPSPEMNLIGKNTEIMAKNSVVLPRMAMDMNVMKLNIMKLVSAAKKPVSRKPEKAYKSQLKSGKTSTKDVTGTQQKSGSSFLGSFLGGAGSLIGGVASGIGGLVGGIFGAVGGILGGLGSIFGGVIRGLSSLGLPGIVLAIAGSYLISKLFSSISFGGFSQALDGVFASIGTGLKTFFGVNTEENKDKNIIQIFAEKLDKMFDTSKFTQSLNFMVEQTMAHLHATFMMLGDSIMGIGDSIQASVLKWWDDNKLGIYTMIGAVAGSRFGLKGAALGAAIAGGVGLIDKYATSDREGNVALIEKEITSYKADLAGMQGDRNRLTGNKRVDIEKKLKDAEERLSYAKEEIRARNPQSRLRSYQEYLQEGREKYKQQFPTSPTPINSSNLLETIRKAESGSMGYDAINRGTAGDTPGGMPGLSNMTVGEVMDLQKQRKIFAAGAYQIIPETLESLVKMGVVKPEEKFDTATQDRLATALINEKLVLAGNDPIKQQLELSKLFASIADPTTGKSRYDGIAGNKASIGSILNTGSVAMSDSRMNFMSKQPFVVNAPQTTNVQQPSSGGMSGGLPSVVDQDFMKYLVGRAT
jgi:hypothetical protein